MNSRVIRLDATGWGNWSVHMVPEPASSKYSRHISNL